MILKKIMGAIYEKNRSKVMSSIRSKNTKTELMLRKALFNKGLRYRIHYKIYGRPDIVFPKQKIAIFVDGDFWHGYNWKELKIIPKKGFWRDKIKKNIERDRRNDLKLKRQNWRVLHFWEHEILENVDKPITRIISVIKKNLKQ